MSDELPPFGILTKSVIPYRLRNSNCIECKFDYGVIKIERGSLIALLAEKFVASYEQAKIKSDVRHRCAGARVSHCACATYHEGFARTSSGRRASKLTKFHSTSVAAWLSSGVDVSCVKYLNVNTSVIRSEVIDGVVCLVLLLCCEVWLTRRRIVGDCLWYAALLYTSIRANRNFSFINIQGLHLYCFEPVK